MKFPAEKYINLMLAVISILCISNTQAGLTTLRAPYAFSWIWDSDANPADGVVGEQQLSFTVSEATGIDGVVFTFSNAGELSCSLTDIYFESSLGTLEGLISIDDSSEGVSFSQGADPSNMPRWKKVDFEPTLGMTAGSNHPAVSHNGINNPDEWLSITVATQAGLDQIRQELDNQDIRIGIHVQAFDDDGSESFITPEPVSMAILALGGLILKRRRKI
jgi:hypothetical protein